jgi:MFS transporter, DHA1 family, solute carrier family 18 (vesicular amine transporter), member 1/2
MPFLITGIAFALAGVLIALLLPTGGRRRSETIDFRALLFNRSMMIPAVAVALAAFSLGIIEPLLPVRLARYGATSTAIGIVFTVSALMYGLSAPLVGRVSERMPIERVIALGTIAMAFTLPFVGLFRSVILIGITVSLVNIWHAFMLNPASAELGNVVDRSGLSCYSACYAVYNIFYSAGMLGTATLVSAAARLLSFRGVLLCATATLLLFVPFLIKAPLPKSVAPAGTGR